MRHDYVDDIRDLINRLSVITESPILQDEDLPLGPVGIIPNEDIADHYNLFSIIQNEIMIYREKTTGNFVAGGFFQNKKDLIEIVAINVAKNIGPVTPTQLTQEPVQVSWARVAEGFARGGLTSLVYQSIAAKIDLVSDRLHYRGGKRLWQSLASTSSVPIYVFDGVKNDYIRANAGEIVMYNGKNITEESIWGGDDKQTVLLVASTSIKK